MSSFTQENRIIKLTTVLGDDALLVTSLRGREGVSQLFHFEVEADWQNTTPMKLTDILGTTVTIKVDYENPPRLINGIVQYVEQGRRDHIRNLIHYTLHVVPNTWELTRNVQSRIFQQKSVPDIIKEVIGDLGFSGTLKTSLQGTYAPRDYCVQYRESDFAFISRLMESEGIFYYYQHDSSQHTLVIADTSTAFQTLPGSAAEIEYEEIFGGNRDQSRIFEWWKTQEIRSGKYAQIDWNFEKPSTDMQTKAQFSQQVGPNQKLEIFEYPGGYMQPGDGDTLSKNRMQGENTPGQVARGRSWHGSLCPGYKFTLKNHYSEDGDYVLTLVEHQAHQPLETGEADEPFEYENRFATIPAANIYRPARVTPPPRVQGVQSAIVVGPSGEEIYTDKYGRVKVQFHWDRIGQKNEKSSCWIRVATFWAGKNWGAIHIPRIGQEVLVDFEDGDVDRPLIVGSVYNAEQMPPYALPGEMTKSTIQSRSTKGGAQKDCNELRFEDKKESEEVYLHANKDWNSVIENNQTTKVGTSKAEDGSRTTEIYNNETHTLKMGNQTITIDQGNQTTKISMGNQTTTISMGNQTTKIDMGAASHEAMQSITLKVGQSSIVLDPTGVTIKGMMISIQGQIQVDVKGLMTNVSADAITTVKGAMVMIN